MKQNPIAFLSIFIAFFSLQASATDIYKWTDSAGKVHYTQFAPEQTIKQAVNLTPVDDKSKPLIPESAQSSSPQSKTNYSVKSATYTQLVDPKNNKMLLTEIKESYKKTENKKIDDQDKEIAAENKKLCEKAKRNLEIFDIYKDADIAIKQSDGTEKTLTPDEREKHFAQTKKEIAYYCQE